MGTTIDPHFGGDTALCLDGVTAERITWLWPGYLPAGKLVVVDGDPSVGKSTLTLDLAARCSVGAPWPDRAPSPGPGAVLLMSAEDGVADTIVPRLDAAGADRARVFALTEVPVLGDDEIRMQPPQLPRDIGFIEQTVRRHHVRLIVVDVLMAYLSGGVDSHKDQDIRVVLHHLAAMADRTGACIILIRHLNKAGGSNPLYRGGGSIGIVGAARAAFIVGRDPDDPDRRIFAVSKMNIAAEPPTLAYRLVSAEGHGCARVEWENGPVDVTARDLVSAPTDPEAQDERNDAASFIRGYLEEQGGQAGAKLVLSAGRAAGFGESTLKNARRKVADTAKDSFTNGSWLWILREGTTKVPKVPAQKAPVPSVPSVVPSRGLREPAETAGIPDDAPRAHPGPTGFSVPETGTSGFVASAGNTSQRETCIIRLHRNCPVCGQKLLAPESRQSGICAKCRASA